MKDNNDIETLKLIKKGESGEREIKLENSLHKYILIQLYNHSQTMQQLHERLGISETQLLQEINKLTKVGFLLLEGNKYATSFIILDEKNTNYLHSNIQKYATNLSTDIIEFFNQNKERILEIDARFNNFKWQELLQLLALIFVDFMNEEPLQDLNSKYQHNHGYNKAYSICGYTTTQNNFVFRNNTIVYNVDYQYQKIGLFTYGKGEIESFNRQMLYSNIPIFDTESYVRLIYIMYDRAQRLRNKVIEQTTMKLESIVPSYLKNQTGFIFQNYIGNLRYELIHSISQNQISDKKSFIFLYDNE